MSTRDRHVPALDGLRGIAILLVLLHHFTIMRPVAAIDRAFSNVAIVGWSGVDLFFVLSGYLITGILLDSRDSPRYFRSFYMRRTLRIFPIYYLVVFLSTVVLPWFPFWNRLLAGPGPLQQPWAYWLYLSNFAIAWRPGLHHGILDISWSLAIEEQFYLLWAPIVWLVPTRRLGLLLAGVIVAAPLARIVALAFDVHHIPVYVNTAFRADSLAFGGLIAWLARSGKLAPWSRVAPWTALAGLAAIAAVAWADGEPWWWGGTMQRIGYSVMAMTAGSLLVAAVREPGHGWWPRALSAGWLRAFGRYSYCLYLIHLPFMRLARDLWFTPGDVPTLAGSQLPGQLLFYLAAGIPAFALAWCSWRFFEAPILRLKSRFPY
jgi:peptidoglycan/LPS O-acetylase OafA/YrhL